MPLTESDDDIVLLPPLRVFVRSSLSESEKVMLLDHVSERLPVVVGGMVRVSVSETSSVDVLVLRDSVGLLLKLSECSSVSDTEMVFVPVAEGVSEIVAVGDGRVSVAKLRVSVGSSVIVFVAESVRDSLPVAVSDQDVVRDSVCSPVGDSVIVANSCVGESVNVSEPLSDADFVTDFSSDSDKVRVHVPVSDSVVEADAVSDMLNVCVMDGVRVRASAG